MKKFDTTIRETRDLDQIRANYPEKNILTLSELLCVRGGGTDGDGDGGGDIIIIPKK